MIDPIDIFATQEETLFVGCSVPEYGVGTYEVALKNNTVVE